MARVGKATGETMALKFALHAILYPKKSRGGLPTRYENANIFSM